MHLRERAMARLAAGESTRVVAIALKVAVSSVIKWSARALSCWRDANSVAGRTCSGALRRGKLNNGNSRMPGEIILPWIFA
jgi:hypothetical protein